MAISIGTLAANILAATAAAAIAAAPVSAASSLSLHNVPGMPAAPAGAELESPNHEFGSTRDILLILGAVGAGLLAAVEWWFDNDDPESP